MEPIAVQTDLFGEPTSLPDWHRVAAHTRVLADGTEVFVGEHLRWNRGRTATEPGPKASEEVVEGQLGLFAK